MKSVSKSAPPHAAHGGAAGCPFRLQVSNRNSDQTVTMGVATPPANPATYPINPQHAPSFAAPTTPHVSTKPMTKSSINVTPEILRVNGDVSECSTPVNWDIVDRSHVRVNQTRATAPFWEGRAQCPEPAAPPRPGLNMHPHAATKTHHPNQTPLTPREQTTPQHHSPQSESLSMQCFAVI